MTSSVRLRSEFAAIKTGGNAVIDVIYFYGAPVAPSASKPAMYGCRFPNSSLPTVMAVSGCD